MKFGTHEGYDVEITKQGVFEATIDKETIVRDTYEALITAVTAKLRRASRVKAAATPVVALIRTRYDSKPPRWVTGTFRGINAHTHDTMLTVEGEKVQYDSPWLFRPDDPKLPAMQALVEAETAARLAHHAALEALEAAKQKHGVIARMGYAADRNAAAAEEEARIVKALGGTMAKEPTHA